MDDQIMDMEALDPPDPNEELSAEVERILWDALMFGLPEKDVRTLCYSTGARWSDVVKQGVRK